MISQYFGIDWLAMGLTFSAVYLLSNRSRGGFVGIMLDNLSWSAVTVNSPAFFRPRTRCVTLLRRQITYRSSSDGGSKEGQEIETQPAGVARLVGEVCGQLFVFINRRATHMKVLYWDRSGFCVRAKRLEAGRFVSDWRDIKTREMDWTGLKLLLEGIEPKVVRKRYKYEHIVDTHAIIAA